MSMLNRKDHYGWGMISIHWLVAITVFGMFAFGYWMVDLDYYHAWYKKGPDLHRSIGVLLLGVMVLRLIWRLLNPPPAAEAGLKSWEMISARLVHWAFYLMIPLIATTGYLITTADGRGLLVFDWFEVPAVTLDIDNQEDLAGLVHWYLALVMMALATVHGLAALKHHLIDKDQTLMRMLGKRHKETP
ncbi:MAG: cytochrome b561 [Candidatus Azotimanducaceae bacterium]|jgi:cytochrome b561